MNMLKILQYKRLNTKQGKSKCKWYTNTFDSDVWLPHTQYGTEDLVRTSHGLEQKQLIIFDITFSKNLSDKATQVIC